MMPEAMRILYITLVCGLLGLPTVLQGQMRDENWKQCKGEKADQAIPGCSALIESGRE